MASHGDRDVSNQQKDEPTLMVSAVRWKVVSTISEREKEGWSVDSDESSTKFGKGRSGIRRNARALAPLFPGRKNRRFEAGCKEPSNTLYTMR